MRLRAVLGLLAMLQLGCGEMQQLDAPADFLSRPSVYVVSYPLKFFAEYLADGVVQVEFPAPAAIDPAYWSPPPEVVLGYQQADLILLNGAGYASWVDTVSLQERTLTDTSASFQDQLIESEDGPVHTHGPQGEHSHGKLAFTTWLDLSLAAEQARAVAAALKRLVPEHAATVDGRLELLLAELSALDAQLLEIGRMLEGTPIVVSHPVYQYFSRRYGLNARALHWEPDVHPDENSFAVLDGLLRTHPARLMIWEAEPLAETRAALAERGIEVVVFATFGNEPVGGDLLSGLRGGIERLTAAAAD